MLKNNPINEIKKNNNHKIVDITYDNKNNDTYKNHKDHYIKYKPDKKNICKSIAKSFYFRRNERNSEELISILKQLSSDLLFL